MSDYDCRESEDDFGSPKRDACASCADLRASLAAAERDLIAKNGTLQVATVEWTSAAKRAEAAESALAEAVEMLAEVYDEWEQGADILEDGEPDGAHLGKALDLSEDQEDRVLAILKKAGHTHAKPTHAQLESALAEEQGANILNRNALRQAREELAAMRAACLELIAAEHACGMYADLKSGNYRRLTDARGVLDSMGALYALSPAPATAPRAEGAGT